MSAPKGRAPKEFVPDFSSNIGADFELWLEDVDDYLKICGVTTAADKKRLFLNLAGLAVRRIVKGIVVPTPPAQADGSAGCEYKALTDAVIAHFRPATNTTSERHRFRQLRQNEGESVTSFVGRLREAADRCEFASTAVDTIDQGQIRDQLIEGLRSQELRKELLKESKLTLANAVSKAVALESSITDSKLYGDAAATPLSNSFSHIHRVSHSQPASAHKKFGKCKYCGRSHPRGKQHCPAADATCGNCSKVGHFTTVCLSRKSDNARMTSEQVEEDDANYFCDYAFSVDTSQHQQLFRKTLIVNGRPCEGLLDTGATRSVLTDDVVQPTRKSDRILKAYNGGVISTLGMADVTVSVGSRSIVCSCFVVPVASGRQILYGQDVISELELLTSAEVNVVNVTPISITVDPDTTPTALPPRRHAFSIRDEIAKELDRLVKHDIIEPVREATPWVSPLVPVRKSSGALRLCVDYRVLNKSVVRERHLLPTVDEINAQLDGATVFSVLDAESGFHQLPLADESRPFTTFATHKGLFRFKRLPFGIACAPEIFQRVVSDILAGLPGVVVYIDDILIYARNRQEHDERMAAVLRRLSEANLRLNWEKCRVRQSEIKYLGHWLSKDGVRPDGDKLLAIQQLQLPQTLTDVRRFLGMVTYLGKFIPQLSQTTEPLRKLAQRQPFVVDDELTAAFTDAKTAVASSLECLAYFKPSLDVPTKVTCDASPLGLGAILWQQDKSGTWLPVTCASRSLSDVESRYSQLEREMLGIVFSLTRFRQYVLGRSVQVVTDHKPLISIVQKPFDEVPPRLQRWMVALMPYQYTLSHAPGKQMVCEDTLSRAPVQDSTASPEEARSMAEFIGLVLEECPVNIDDIAKATSDDPLLRSIQQRVLMQSWSQVTPAEEPYYLIRDQLTTIDGILLFGNRCVIPEALRHAVLQLAHEGHPGRDIFKDALRRRVWWTGMSKDADKFAEQCSECWRRHTNPAQELLPSEIEGVWQKLAVDLVCIEGQQVLSIVDYGSRYPELLPLSATTTAAVIDRLMEVFARFGLPSVLVSDNGPQFASAEMAQFLQRLGIQHNRSSPRYPRSNGMVERLHRVVKERIQSLRPSLSLQRRLQQVLFDIRNSVHRMLGMSPNEAFFGRMVRTRLPHHSTPRIVNASHQIRAKADMAVSHDSRRGVRQLPMLRPGTMVVLQDGYSDPTTPWRVVEQYGRQVGVTDGRRILLRNRQHVREHASPASSTATSSRSLDLQPVPTPDPQPATESEVKSSAPNADVPPATPTAPCEAGVESEIKEADAQIHPESSDQSRRQSRLPRPDAQSGSLYREGYVTRAGRTVKLTEKAAGALM
eukprot:scpid19450/ scgid21866/ Transposon Ty3-I Gag-Pol polyprotein; Gag3-Pol3; Transposon Ty3-2 TYA-TYB polyprotein; Capsid protein; p24; Spacer peptide p3; Nucleocapsid protein p11; Ty3 protease; p16; Spacer peptide J; Reverse transcriptase/ribonuclease H; p55; Integrase p52; Integrase p49